jgi:hypothetical protein
MPDGRWCIGGRVFDHGEIFNLKQIEVQAPGTAGRLLGHPALTLLDETLGLDFSSLKAYTLKD